MRGRLIDPIGVTGRYQLAVGVELEEVCPFEPAAAVCQAVGRQVVDVPGDQSDGQGRRQQAGPAAAIEFGNIKDPNSRVSQLPAQERDDQGLDHLYTRPRLTPPAKVRNPNPAIPGTPEYPQTTEEYRKSMMADPKGNPYAAHGHATEHGAPGAHGSTTAPHGSTTPATQGTGATKAEPKGGHH